MKRVTYGISMIGRAAIAGALCVLGTVGAVAQTGSADPETAVQDGSIRLNFRDASLDNVLDYLSEAAGFVIVREIEVSGTVNVWSHQALSKDEAVNLLNTILNSKGYAAVRNGRILTIMSREDAKLYSLPVRLGNDPEAIAPTDEMVTQIIPVRYTDAVKLIEDLRPLIPEYAEVSANESANAIVLTDTQVNIRRMVRIIQALDTSISSISTLQVFILKYSDATETAKLVNEIFASPSAGRGSSRSGDSSGFRGGFSGRGDSRGGSRTASASEARLAIARVLAVADTRTNAVVVSAPEELIPTIEEVIEKIDTMTEPLQEIQVFPLKFASAENMAKVINDSFTPDQSRNRNNRGGRGGPGGGRFSFFSGGPREGGDRGGNGSTSTLREYQVTAVADTRTNSVIVTAESEIMPQIKRVVESLDANPARKKKVYIYDLQNADGQALADMLNSMLNNGTTGGSRANTRNTNQGQQTTTGQGGRATGAGNQGGGRFN